MHRIAKEIVDLIVKPYADEFIYLNTDFGSHTFDPESLTLAGEVVYNGAPYFKNNSIIFNNTEYLFVFNQSAYLLVFLLLLQEHKLRDSVFRDTEVLVQQYQRLGGIVVKEHRITFSAPLYGTLGQRIPYTHTITNYRKFKGSLILFLHLKIADSEIVTKASLVNKDLHQVH